MASLNNLHKSKNIYINSLLGNFSVISFWIGIEVIVKFHKRSLPRKRIFFFFCIFRKKGFKSTESGMYFCSSVYKDYEGNVHVYHDATLNWHKWLPEIHLQCPHSIVTWAELKVSANVDRTFFCRVLIVDIIIIIIAVVWEDMLQMSFTLAHILFGNELLSSGAVVG